MMIPSRKLQVKLPKLTRIIHIKMDVLAPTIELKPDSSEIARDLNSLKTAFPTNGNAINFVTTLIEGRAKGEFEAAENEAYNNILTAVIEHPLAASVGFSHYDSLWDENWSLTSGFGNIYEIIKLGVNDKTGQVPAFEQPRNVMDGVGYLKLRQARMQGNRSDFFLFSPAPPNPDSPEVVGRGYEGNGQIRIFEARADGHERCYTHTFPDLSAKDYALLFSKLIQAAPESATANQLRNALTQREKTTAEAFRKDLWVMNQSGIFEKAQAQVLREFIKETKTRYTDNRELIESYAFQIIGTKVAQQIMPLADEASSLLMQNNIDASQVNTILLDIEEAIARFQFELRLYIEEHTGINTFGKQLDFTYSEFMAAGNLEQDRLYIDSEVDALGCGFRYSSDVSMTTMASEGSTALARAERSGGGSMFDKELYEYTCDKCGYIHNINVPEGEYVEKCEGCGADARC